MATPTPDELLLTACAYGDLEESRTLLSSEDADAAYHDDQGRTPLFVAAERGHLALVQLLVENGAPWNLLDESGQTAAERAMAAGFLETYEWLVSEGVRAERLFAALRAMGMVPAQPETNADYLQQKLVYSADGERLLDEHQNGVMMGWERPIMRATVDALCGGKSGLRVLNVGFGLGIIDSMLQATLPTAHHIIEAHPDVLAHIAAHPTFGSSNPTVTVHAGTWRSVVPDLLASGQKFDAIYFDTYAEYYSDNAEFHDAAASLLAPGGRYSWFHGQGASNAVFNEVYRRIADADVEALGLVVEWTQMEMAPLGDAVWNGIRLNYFSLDHYWLPVATKPASSSSDPAQQ
ncbi:arginine N-methyltransferase [Blastocladiella britannica]|nr:arginine N-methyltransferase [Blastocladiella britannica]